MATTTQTPKKAGPDAGAVYAALLNAAGHVGPFVEWCRGFAPRRPSISYGNPGYDPKKGDPLGWADDAVNFFAGVPWAMTCAAYEIRDEMSLRGWEIDGRRKLVAARFDPAAADARPREHFLDVMAELDHCADILREVGTLYRGIEDEPICHVVRHLDGAAWAIRMATQSFEDEADQDEWEAAWDRLEARLGVAESAPA